MRFGKPLAALGALVLLGACSSSVMRPAPFETLPAGTGPAPTQVTAPTDVAARLPEPAAQPDTTLRRIAPSTGSATAAPQAADAARWRVADIRIEVPDSLKVSEANSLIPDADIVWREDPFGDRRAQVREILDLALRQAALSLDGSEPVVLDIRLRKFHALSQKARATVGGIHNIAFDVTIRDPQTGRPLQPTFPVEIRLRALGGQKAIEAEMRGETQKVRIMREIARVMHQRLAG